MVTSIPKETLLQLALWVENKERQWPHKSGKALAQLIRQSLEFIEKLAPETIASGPQLAAIQDKYGRQTYRKVLFSFIIDVLNHDEFVAQQAKPEVDEEKESMKKQLAALQAQLNPKPEVDQEKEMMKNQLATLQAQLELVEEPEPPRPEAQR